MNVSQAVADQLRAGLVADYERGVDPRPLLAMLRRGRRMALVKVRPATQENGPLAIAEAACLAPLLEADEVILCSGALVLNPAVPEDDPRRIDRRIVLEMHATPEHLGGSATAWDPEAGVGPTTPVVVDAGQPVPLSLWLAVSGSQPLGSLMGGYALATVWRLTSLGHSIVVTPAATSRLARRS